MKLFTMISTLLSFEMDFVVLIYVCELVTYIIAEDTRTFVTHILLSTCLLFVLALRFLSMPSHIVFVDYVLFCD